MVVSTNLYGHLVPLNTVQGSTRYSPHGKHVESYFYDKSNCINPSVEFFGIHLTQLYAGVLLEPTVGSATKVGSGTKIHKKG